MGHQLILINQLGYYYKMELLIRLSYSLEYCYIDYQAIVANS
jgi:hypothetical protein